MILSKEFKDWIELQSKKLEIRFAGNQTQTERLYARTIKLNEEVGELCEEILAHNNDQRKDKLDNKSENDLAHEIADVLITTLLIAESLKIDPNKALEQKIEKINKRFADVEVI